MAKTNKKLRLTLNAPVISIFIGLCALALILNQITYARANDLFFSIYRSSPADPLFYIRLFGHVLGHSGWQHFLNNATLILITGPLLEEKYGSKKILLVILLTALATGLAHLAIVPSRGLLGASGVAFALILLSSMTQIKDGEGPVTFVLVAVLYIGQEILSMLTVSNNISNSTHIIGGCVGAVSGFLMNKNQNREGGS
ncbi:MAG: rhomboid family intramembrane serine protease [Roseburia sp.]|nr:rhomboid family intramembrane serine protease [Roseburia sp.]